MASCRHVRSLSLTNVFNKRARLGGLIFATARRAVAVPAAQATRMPPGLAARTPDPERKNVPMAADIAVYEKPTCTTCRNLAVLLREQGIDWDSIEYHVLGLTEPEVRDLIRKAGVPARDLLRKREADYKTLGFDQGEPGDDEVIAAMVANPALLQRPIVVRGDRAVLARPIERALELFD